MKLTKYIHYVPQVQTAFDKLVEELVPKRPQFKAPTQQKELYMACIAAPHLSIIFCNIANIDDVPQNIPAVVYTDSSTSEHRFAYNTLYLHSVTDITTFKESIKSFLARLPRNIVAFPVLPKHSPMIFWQYPVITEKYSLESIATQKSDCIYVGIPYATLIDKNIVPTLELVSIKSHIDALKAESPTKRIYTSCQHIHYSKILDIVKMLGITDIFISHKQKGQPHVLNGIRIHGLPLYPVNVFDKTRTIGIPDPLPQERKYLFSFIGAHMNHYLNPIRKHILSWSSTSTPISTPPLSAPTWFIQDTKIWHFEKNVYQHQVRGAELTAKDLMAQGAQTVQYNSILADSTFSLCPVGAGPNTIRLWESICLNSIPVIIADEFDIRDTIPKDKMPSEPFYLELPYNSPHVQSPETLADYLSKITPQQIEMMRKGCEHVKAYLETTFLLPPSSA